LSCIFNFFFLGQCSKECSDDGCWGPTDIDCLSCSHYFIKEQQRCVESCETADGFYADVQSRECKRCHAECRSACTGPVSLIYVFFVLLRKTVSIVVNNDCR
jgi:hypothetical protein